MVPPTALRPLAEHWIAGIAAHAAEVGLLVVADADTGPRPMRAAVLWKTGGPLEVTEVVLDPPCEGEVEVAIAHSGVCGSDVHQLVGEYDLPLPCVLGHEGAGVVARVGPGVRTVRPGDHVVVLWRSSCGACRYCLNGRPALCDVGNTIRTRGVMPDGRSRIHRDGRTIHHFVGVSSFAEYAVLQERAVVRIREDLPLHAAALVGCGVITGVGAAWRAGAIRPGQAAAVFGCGGVGLNVVQGCRLAGADPVVAVDTRPEKEAMARSFGATRFVLAPSDAAPEQSDAAVAAVRQATDGGADVAFEAIGLPAVMQLALASLRKGGKLVLVGIAPTGSRLPLDPAQLVLQEITVRGSVYGSSVPQRDIPGLLEMYASGRLQLEELVSAHYPLSEVNEAFAHMRTGRAGRVLIDNAR